ncbi:MAG: 50S ribosomal protein L18 [Candidatus Caenarcaniphilales bacterium]|nr:50S ribosomal protein L18 [Candidatus Caenarcaniphilales bacterium]
MSSNFTKKQILDRAHRRVRKKVIGTAEKPRLAAHKSGKHIYAQLIDDQKGITLAFASSLDEGLRKEAKHGGNCDSAKRVGKLLAEKAKSQKITNVVFDRGGHLYHGRIKSLADAAREAGLEF